MSCGPGTRIRTRRCDSPPPGPGGRCIGLPLENKACDDGPCPGSKRIPKSPLKRYILSLIFAIAFITKQNVIR